ncbi:MAG: peptidylprolyl isomerase [Bacteroidota bacterium]|nr:peptidylprolyl isomerase [Bacteroidota bacterium]
MTRIKPLNRLLMILAIMPFLTGGSCKKKTPEPVASFTYSIENGTRTATFRSTSKNAPTTTTWDFGDGNVASGDSATHTFAKDSTYKITLTVANEGGTHTTSQIINVSQTLKIAKITTSFGELVIWLYNETPLHKANFLKLAEEGFYNGTTFHRCIKDFVIQGGDPNSKDTDPNNDGQGGPGYTVPAEIRSTLKHSYGAVAAARMPDQVNPAKASSGSQFYIVVNTAGTHFLDNNYTVFGKVISDMAPAQEIVQQSKDSRDRPITDIKMEVVVLDKTLAELKSEYNFVP